MYLITGGCGFIGSALIRYLNSMGEKVVNVDKLTYAGNLNNLKSLEHPDKYHFYEEDIGNKENIEKILLAHKPKYIMNLAAESHVDRSIDGPSAFIETNIIGTFKLLEASVNYFNSLKNDEKLGFKFHHISTDEVFGDLRGKNDYFTESTPYMPSSPYSASKAASDHLVRSWNRTFNLPTIITNCSNNYGPYHYPEKLIPLTIINALKGNKIPVYGDGQQVRDWLHVDDHAKALVVVVNEGESGQTFNIGGKNEVKNIEVVTMICNILDEIVLDRPKDLNSFSELISFVNDRPGHDERYAIDPSHIENTLNWKPVETFSSGLRKTIEWYLENEWWWKPIIKKELLD